MDDNQKNEMFQYTYSAKEQEELQQIRRKYLPKEETKMEQIHRLDAQVTQKATMVSIVVGVIGLLVLGVGMSLVMTDLGTALGDFSLVAGIIIGIAGMILIGIAYPLNNYVLKKEREKIAPEILRLTEELMK